jgi:hypothetical protein
MGAGKGLWSASNEDTIDTPHHYVNEKQFSLRRREREAQALTNSTPD